MLYAELLSQLSLDELIKNDIGNTQMVINLTFLQLLAILGTGVVVAAGFITWLTKQVATITHKWTVFETAFSDMKTDLDSVKDSRQSNDELLKKMVERIVALENHAETAALRHEIMIIKSQMVGWDTLTRIERTLALIASSGNGNQAMGAVSDVLKAERESREGTRQ
jgi:hypothetical protein